MADYVIPNSTIVLYSDVELDNTYQHTYYFSSHEDRDTLFDSYNIVATIGNTMYQVAKDTGKIRVYADKMRIDRAGRNISMYRVNYLKFKNTDYENRWFYCFVTDVTYLNDNVCEITYELDYMVTFFFDYSLGTSFVEREHTIEDSIEYMRVPEDLETGEYVFARNTFTPIISRYCDQHIKEKENPNDPDEPLDIQISLVLIANDTYDPAQLNVVFRRLDGLPTSFIMFDTIYATYNRSTGGWTFNSALQAFYDDTIQKYVAANKQDALIGMFLYPTALLPKENDAESTNTSVQFHFDDPRIFGSYEPFNRKLFTYPYQFIYFRDTAGNSKVYQFEFGSNPRKLNFLAAGNLLTTPTEIVMPFNYKKVENNIDEAISFSNFPQLAMTTDTYKSWLAENGVITTLSGLKGVVGGLSQMGAGIGGIALGSNLTKASGAVSAVTGLASAGIATAMTAAKFHQALIQPNQTLGNNSATVFTALFGFNMFAGIKQITPEMAQCIDDYFSMYGYATHRCKVPYQHARKLWTYTKTIGCVLTGSVPNMFLKKIAQVYDNGITFWVTSEKGRIGNYEQYRIDDFHDTERLNSALREG